MLTGFERLRQTSSELVVAQEINRLLTDGLPLEEFCPTLIVWICYNVSDIDSGLIFVRKFSGEEFTLLDNYGVTTTMKNLGSGHPIMKYLKDRIAEEKPKSEIVADSEKITFLLSDMGTAEKLMLLLLIIETDLLGFILLLNRKEKEVYTPGITDLLNSITDQVARAVKSIQTRPLK